MSVRGVVKSALYDKALRGDQSEVPLGAPILTNDPRSMSEAVRLLTHRTELTEPKLEQIEAFGVNSLFAGRDGVKSSLTFGEEADVNERRLVEASFDPDTGELVLVRQNKEVLRIPDFLRSDQLGRGPTGPRGQQGKDAFSGRTGRDGRKGATGCEGPQGSPGRNGEPGMPGNHGTIGRQGPNGCEGATGDTGARGAVGPHGFEGPRGLTGPSCEPSGTGDGTGDGSGEGSGQGQVGPSGLAFGMFRFGSLGSATPEVAIVGLDDDGIDSNVGAVAPVKPPVVSVPVVPAPPPPAVGNGTVTPCKASNLGSAANSCGSNVKVWYSINVYPGAAGPDGSKGISGLIKANNTAFWPWSSVFCGSFTKGAKYTVDLHTPAQVSAQLFIDCKVSLVSETGTTRASFVAASQVTGIRVRYYGKAAKIPVWFALVIRNADGAVVYKSGQQTVSQTVTSLGKPVTVVTDMNWAGNSAPQTIGTG